MLNKKGMIGIYCLMYLCVILFYCSLLMRGLQQYLYFRENLDSFRRLNNAEALTIMHIKRQFSQYKEKDEVLRYEGCRIEINYSGTTAYVTIDYKGVIRERELVFDEVSETVMEYK